MIKLFSYGCPRSGTTAMQHVLTGCVTDYQKIREGDLLHPCRSDSGLLSLAQLYRDGHTVIFIRTIRSSIEIFESFYAMLHFNKTGVAGPSATKMVKRMSVNTDERIFEYILNEHRNTDAQKAHGYPWPFNIVEAGYRMLNLPYGRRGFYDDIQPLVGEGIAERIFRKMAEIWGKEPVREGRMSHGLTKSLLSDDLKAEIRERCLF